MQLYTVVTNYFLTYRIIMPENEFLLLTWSDIWGKFWK